MVITWLSNRETEKSLNRARKSEKELQAERDNLEIKMEEKTKELKKVQMEKMAEIYRFVEFGRAAGGFLHDIINPLTAISLDLEQIHQESCKKNLTFSSFKDFLNDAIASIKRMEGFVQSARRQLQQQDVKNVFSILDEVNSVTQIISHKANQRDVMIDLVMPDYIEIYGNPAKFNHLLTHLISNAIDSYENPNCENKKVEISVIDEGGKIKITVQDWGCGIPEEIAGKIFDPFFTTKGIEQGTGIGLSICKKIVEKDFGGTIEVESRKNIGTRFAIVIPPQGGQARLGRAGPQHET